MEINRQCGMKQTKMWKEADKNVGINRQNVERKIQKCGNKQTKCGNKQTMWNEADKNVERKIQNCGKKRTKYGKKQTKETAVILKHVKDLQFCRQW